MECRTLSGFHPAQRFQAAKSPFMAALLPPGEAVGLWCDSVKLKRHWPWPAATA